MLEPPETLPGKPAAAEVEKPSFDIVRVDPDGQAVVAGRSEPGWHVAVKINGETRGETVANERGEWVWVTKDPIKPGSSEITVEARREPAAPPLASSQAVDVVVSDAPGKQALVVLSEASRPSRVMQSPEEEPQAGGPKVALAPPGDTAPTAAEVPEKAAKPQAEPRPVKRPVSLDVVDYDDAGEIIFSGRGSPGATVRLYVDNNPVGDAAVNGQGAWTLSGRGRIAPGQHALRVDELGPAAKVESRVELPFVRAKPAEVAALAPPAEKPQAASPPAAQSASPTPAAPPVVKPAEQQALHAPSPSPAAESEPEATQKSDKLASTAEPSAASSGTGSAEPSANSVAAVEPPVTKLTEIPAKPEPTPKVSEPATALPPATASEPSRAPQSTTTAPPATASEPSTAPQPTNTAPPAAASEPSRAPQPMTTAPPAAASEPSKAPEPPKAEQQAMGNAEATAGLPEAATGGAPALKAQPAEAPRPRNGRVVIQPGNNLWNISRVIYGKGTRYTVIYRANKELIRSPRLIYPGQIFATPGSVPPVSIDPSWRKPLAEIVGDGAAPN